MFYFWNTLRHTLAPSLSTQMVQSLMQEWDIVLYSLPFVDAVAFQELPLFFTAELSAVIFTLPVSSFIIFSALSVLEHFTSSLPPLILFVLEWIHLLQCRGYHVIFYWIPAHVGIHGNELGLLLPPQFPFMTYNPV